MLSLKQNIFPVPTSDMAKEDNEKGESTQKAEGRAKGNIGQQTRPSEERRVKDPQALCGRFSMTWASPACHLFLFLLCLKGSVCFGDWLSVPLQPLFIGLV